MAQTYGFVTRFADLPAALPVFPLDGVLLLPGGRLPLNIFEPRYLAMVDDALAGDRLIGMLQPQAGEGDAVVPQLYATGCAGRLTSFSETGDNRYLITLYGVSRFDVVREIESDRGYRRIVPDWAQWRDDTTQEPDPDIDRGRLLETLRRFFDSKAAQVDWDRIEQLHDVPLVTTLAMICPFDASEKQALLMAEDSAARAKAMVAMLEMALYSTGGTENARH